MRKKAFIFSISTILIIFLSSFAFSVYDDDFELIKYLEIYQNVLKKLKNHYVENIDFRKVITASIRSMLKQTDPYTVFYSESQLQDLRNNYSSDYVGLGIIVTQIDSSFYIAKVLKGGNAEINDVQVGDKIISINGVKLKGKKFDEVNLLFKGEVNTLKKVVFERNGELLEKELVLKTIKKQSVAIDTIIDSIGYIKFTEFIHNSSKDFADKFKKLKKSGISGLIIDLRGNPGGELIEAVNIASMFLQENQLVVSMRSVHAENNQSFFTRSSNPDLNLPLAVLVDNNSASASEILSGALQDYDRAVLIGQRTFGKGLVQRFFDLGYSTKMKLTIAKYYIPSGRCIQAIDYFGHGSIDSTVGYKTMNRRIVYAGHGLSPDIKVFSDSSNLLNNLVKNGVIFMFVRELVYKHQNLSLTADYFNEFLDFFSRSKFKYSFDIYKDLEKLQKFSNDESYQQKIQQIEKALDKQFVLKLTQERPAINQKIREVIASFTNNNKFNLTEDTFLSAAISILKNSSEYNKILKK